MWRKGWAMKISEVKEREARGRERVRLRVVASPGRKFYEEAEVCAV